MCGQSGMVGFRFQVLVANVLMYRIGGLWANVKRKFGGMRFRGVHGGRDVCSLMVYFIAGRPVCLATDGLPFVVPDFRRMVE